MSAERREPLSLSDAARQLLEECRMVLPGIQALFGFQLIAVFNQNFSEKLSPGLQALHLAAIGFVAIAVALVMAPAAYHRIVEPESVSEGFVEISTKFLLFGMFPPALGTCLDFFLIANIILQSVDLSIALAATLFLIFSFFWFYLPKRNSGRKNRATR